MMDRSDNSGDGKLSALPARGTARRDERSIPIAVDQAAHSSSSAREMSNIYSNDRERHDLDQEYADIGTARGTASTRVDYGVSVVPSDSARGLPFTSSRRGESQVDEGCLPLQITHHSSVAPKHLNTRRQGTKEKKKSRHLRAARPGAVLGVASLPDDVQGMEEECKMEETVSYEQYGETEVDPVAFVAAAAYGANDNERTRPLVEHIEGPHLSAQEPISEEHLQYMDDSPRPDSSVSSSNEIAITAHVVNDEDIEARAHQRFLDAAVEADVVKPSFVARRRLLLVALAIVIVAAVVAVVVITVGRNSSSSPSVTSPTQCSLCADGSIPQDLDETSFDMGADVVSCSNLMASQAELDPSDDKCMQGQSTGWLYCGCPTLPTFPQTPACTLCPDGSPLLNDASTFFANRSCADWNTYVAHLGQNASSECESMRKTLDACECAADPDFLLFLADLFFTARGNAIPSEGTPQYDALKWLATKGAVTADTDEDILHQRYALAVLFYATGGPQNDGLTANDTDAADFGWRNEYGFLTTDGVCFWNDNSGNGASCNEDGDVEELVLNSNNLNGTIPDELVFLSGLRVIKMKDNKLFNTLPIKIGNLTSMVEIDLSGNQLGGSIPVSLGNLTNLQEVFLSENQFTGQLPPIGSLSRLEVLSLGNNMLSGTIPQVENLSLLSVVSLPKNRLVGLIPAFSKNLSEISLAGNLLSGTLDAFFNSGPTNASAVGLTKVHMEDNMISGSLPKSIGHFTQLEEIGFKANRLNGSMPSSLGDLVYLTLLDINGNSIFGSIPTELGRLTKLVSLDLSLNQLSGVIPAELENCSELANLGLARCGLGGTFPLGVGNLPNLEVLLLQGNHFTNDFITPLCMRDDRIDRFILSCFSNAFDCPCCSLCCDSDGLNCEAEESYLAFLANLVRPISGDAINDTSSPQYAALEWLANDDPANLAISSTALKNRFIFATLYFSTNGASWTNQYNFLSASDICDWNDGGTNGIVCNEDLGFEITLVENGLAGPFPEEITYLDELVKLDVDDNLITGTIPESIGRLSLLETVDLKGNSMHGTLPSPLFDLPKLESVSMFMNEDISGTIPQNVGNAVSLRELIIGVNSITGTIPSSVSNLRSLEVFVIAFNEISGSIPDLDNSPQLNTIFLHSNIKLSGSIPSSIGNLPRLRHFTASKNALTGKIPSFAGNSGTLEELWLYENLLTGISDFFETAAGNSLKVVQCHHNQFQDSLPSRIGQFSNLRILDISDNQMVGSIPTEVGILPIQAYKGLSDDPGSFDIGNNRMTGTIPSQLGRFSMADRIDVGRNQLTGPIPSELGQCIQMSTLHVGFNQLEGTVPTELAALPLLDRLYVMGNDGITGDLDTFFCSRPTPFTDIWSDCLRDDVTCSCCGHCCASSDSFSCKDAPF